MKLVRINDEYYLLSDKYIEDGRTNFWTYDHLNHKPLHIDYIKYFGNDNNGKGSVQNGRASFKTMHGTSSGTEHKEIIAHSDRQIEGMPLLDKEEIEHYISAYKLSEVEKLANKEFENVGDEKLFPNHSDKDIWVSGFKSGYEYKRFTEEDMYNCFWKGINARPSITPSMTASEIKAGPEKIFKEFIESTNKEIELDDVDERYWDIQVEMVNICNIGCTKLVLNGERSMCCGEGTPRIKVDHGFVNIIKIS